MREEGRGHAIDGESRGGDASHHAGARVEQQHPSADRDGECGPVPCGVGERSAAPEDDQLRWRRRVPAHPWESALGRERVCHQCERTECTRGPPHGVIDPTIMMCAFGVPGNMSHGPFEVGCAVSPTLSGVAPGTYTTASGRACFTVFVAAS